MVKPPAPYTPRTIQERLDEIKRRENLPSDYKLALFLGIGETALANYRKGRSLPDADTAIKIAHAMGEEPSLVMMEIEAQRAKSHGAKVAWSVALGLVAGALGLIPKKPAHVGGGGKVDITSVTSTTPGGDPAGGSVSSIRPKYASYQ